MIITPFGENSEVSIYKDGVLEIDSDARSIYSCLMPCPNDGSIKLKHYTTADEAGWARIIAVIKKAQSISEIMDLIDKEKGRETV